MVKIDVQGHEVLVLEGMRKALEQRRVLYVMLEFWPRAIKTTSQRTGEEVRWSCRARTTTPSHPFPSLGSC